VLVHWRDVSPVCSMYSVRLKSNVAWLSLQVDSVVIKDRVRLVYPLWSTDRQLVLF